VKTILYCRHIPKPLMPLIYRLLLIAILFPCAVLAQNNFKPGFVVTTKGDTLRGVIDLTHGNNLKEIRFKSSPADNAQIFTPASISYYNVENVASYLSYNGKISTGHTDISKISNIRDTTSVQANVFIKIEQQGDNVNLYSYSDFIKTRYFVKETNNTQPVELEFRVYFIKDQVVQIKNEEYYKIQLINLAGKYGAGNEKLINTINQSNYKLGDLQAVCKAINKNSIVANNNNPKYFRFFAGVALNSTKTDPKNASLPFYNASASTYLFPEIMAGVDFYPDPVVKKFVIRAQLSATKNKYNTSVDSYTDSRPLSKTTYGFNRSNVAFTAQFLYNFYYTYNFKVYAAAGISVNFSSYSGNTYHNLYTDQISYNALDLPKTWATFPVKVGAVIKNKIGAFVGYLPSANMVLPQTSMQVGVDFYF
jgi:hypothetical protein